MTQKSERGLFLLVVEQEPAYVQLIRRSLEENSRYVFEVDEAPKLQEALHKIRFNQYDLILVEERLQEEDGLNLLAELRTAGISIPFVLMADVRQESLVQKAFSQGVTDLVIKSESQFHELAMILERSIEEHRKQNPETAGKEPVKKDLGERRVEFARSRRMANDLRHRDELTGLYNHSFLHECLLQEYASASRYGHALSCLFIDIDYFRQLNEKFGFAAGDQMLRECSDLLFENCRMSDIVARYGGEEFAVLLPHTDYAGAMRLAERLRGVFAGHTFFPEKYKINLTVSMGIASFPQDIIETYEDLITYSSQAVLRAKIGGRNRISCYRDIMPSFRDIMPNLKISEDKILVFQRRLCEISDMARKAYLNASRALITALESKDRFTAGHSANMAKYAIQVAEKMGMKADDAEVVHHAVLLHDIGKLCIPDEILLKEGALTFQEYEIMKEHAVLGYKMLKPIKFLQEEAVLVLHHHEWFNGNGYPKGLKGNEIPLGSRIISVLDSFDTIRMAGGRYKKTAGTVENVKELIDCAGTQFDPVVVRAFVEVLKSKGEIKDGEYDKNLLEEKIRALTLPEKAA